MVDATSYFAFVAASAAIIILPGPTVTLIVTNSLRHGSTAGLGNVLGTQAGLALIIAALAAGLQLILQATSTFFDVLKLVGAAYLIYLGVRLVAAKGELARPDTTPRRRSFFWQGFLVAITNPKLLLFVGAFIPQFVDPAGSAMGQTLLLGGTFMVVATLLDGCYALLAGHARHWLTRPKLRAMELVGATALIVSGIWLAFSRRAA